MQLYILQLLYPHAGSSESNVKQLCLPSDDHPAISSELKIGSSSAGVNLANELARGIPDMNTVATTRIDAPSRVSVNTYEESDCEDQEWAESVPSGMKAAV